MSSIEQSTPNSAHRTEGFASSSFMAKRLRPFLGYAIITLFAFLVLVVYILPLTYMFITAFKSEGMVGDPFAPVLWPAGRTVYEYEGDEYDIYNVPLKDGSTKQLALVEKGREQSGFIDPDNPEAGIIEWNGRWRSLEPGYAFQPQFGNFATAWNDADYPNLLRNTFILELFGIIGMVVSSTMVAYGFARFRIPGEKLIFAILIGTLFIPRELLNIPLVRYYSQIGWMGTMLPLIVPNFFANALYVFLLRQYFRTLPREVDEAAMIDGANPVRILISIIVPQSIPIIVTVALLQFFFIWKDFFNPLLYLTTRRDLQPISIGLRYIASGFGAETTIVMAGAVIIILVPALVFLVSNKYILQAASYLGVRK